MFRIKSHPFGKGPLEPSNTCLLSNVVQKFHLESWTDRRGRENYIYADYMHGFYKYILYADNTFFDLY